MRSAFIVIVALACLITSLAATGAHAVAVRRRGVAKPPDGELLLPPFNAQPVVVDSVFFSWTIRLDNVTRRWTLAGRFNFTANTWFGIGLRSAKRMGGPLVICHIDPVTVNASCDDYYAGETYDAPVRMHTGRTVATDADLAPEGDGYIVFDSIVQLGNESNDEATITRDGFSRVIFARGIWDATRNAPIQHASDDIAAMMVNFDSGEVVRFDADSHKIVFFVLAAAVPLSAAVGFVDSNRHYPRSPMRLRAMISYFGIACYVGLLILYIGLRYNDYVARVAGKALWRAVGDGATFVMSCMILPVSKRGLFHDG